MPEPDTGAAPPARAAVRGLAFALSDNLIAFDRFRAPIPESAYPVILLYWLGQTGLALSTHTRDPPTPRAREP